MKDLFLWICAAPSLIGFAMVISLGIWGFVTTFADNEPEIL
ncbi:MAG: hypothetical protein OSJ76_05250 [Alphaproteobacteria bacterium]|nr:hypothetical protein [Alphaproteobacteria bacterium]